MICIIAGNFDEASTWASGQNLSEEEWFYPEDEKDLTSRCEFHVIVVGTAGYNVPSAWFNNFYELAQRRGRMNRGQDSNRTITN